MFRISGGGSENTDKTADGQDLYTACYSFYHNNYYQTIPPCFDVNLSGSM